MVKVGAAVIIDVTLDGRGNVRIETDSTDVSAKALVTHAVTELIRGSGPKPTPIGFGAGERCDIDRNYGQDPDPYEAGEVIR
jgi:hypothetical protein